MWSLWRNRHIHQYIPMYAGTSMHTCSWAGDQGVHMRWLESWARQYKFSDALTACALFHTLPAIGLAKGDPNTEMMPEAAGWASTEDFHPSVS